MRITKEDFSLVLSLDERKLLIRSLSSFNDSLDEVIKEFGRVDGISDVTTEKLMDELVMSGKLISALEGDYSDDIKLGKGDQGLKDLLKSKELKSEE